MKDKIIDVIVVVLSAILLFCLFIMVVTGMGNVIGGM